jgi:hypothetical protein
MGRVRKGVGLLRAVYFRSLSPPAVREAASALAGVLSAGVSVRYIALRT